MESDTEHEEIDGGVHEVVNVLKDDENQVDQDDNATQGRKNRGNNNSFFSKGNPNKNIPKPSVEPVTKRRNQSDRYFCIYKGCHKTISRGNPCFH